MARVRTSARFRRRRSLLGQRCVLCSLSLIISYTHASLDAAVPLVLHFIRAVLASSFSRPSSTQMSSCSVNSAHKRRPRACPPRGVFLEPLTALVFGEYAPLPPHSGASMTPSAAHSASGTAH
ncbi:hypothetical protein B0H16DRAFT_1500404 [Mycena metata]|uniref:Uncharacterized protein n=1 Tax=Mycena metata TaxID=1033252 RepID=A0AAD7K7I0_9AGAR|nr:hypothetical protein B0H16DRAFT_1500322 [Mycena metata]KAJ7780020.1 hypothetical protein B0H16DRAFT_1500404 [Mycena metata]